MIRAFLVWLQTRLGKGPGPDDASWSEALLGSLNFWGLLEGTHLLLLMLFVGCILAVDLRLMGVLYRRTPVSVVSRRLLPSFSAESGSRAGIRLQPILAKVFWFFFSKKNILPLLLSRVSSYGRWYKRRLE